MADEPPPPRRELVVIFGASEALARNPRHRRDLDRRFLERRRRMIRRRQEEEEEEEHERLTRPPPLFRGISSFVQESNVFGLHSMFRDSLSNTTSNTPGVEQVIASPNFDAKRLFIKRVTACIGWAVHGIVFELYDNTRVGCILDGFAETRLDLTDENIQKRRGAEWHNVDYGDYIVAIHGNQLHNTTLLWFCHSVVLEFRSGKTICLEASHEPWRGEPFAYQVPQPCLVYRVAFRHEQTQDMRGLVTSIHLALSLANMVHLPLENKRTVEAILGVLQDVDVTRESQGFKALSDDLWWNILGWIRAWEMPVVTTTTTNSTSGDVQEEEAGLVEQFEGFSMR